MNMNAEHTPGRFRNVDRDNMWSLLFRFPDQWREAMAICQTASWNLDRSRIRNVLFAGMGGSAIGADLIRAYSLNSSPVPVYVNRNYRLPSWVDEQTLVVACSFSGDTEETLSALDEAMERGAQVAAVTSGGKLLMKMSAEGRNYVKVPGGMPPRAALAYSFVPLFSLFSYLGFLKESDTVLEETAVLLEEQARFLSDTESSRAMDLARQIQDTMPILYTGPDLLDPVGTRWCCQFEENAKILSYRNVVPEMNHNEIVGWEQVAHLTGRISVILLEDREDHPKVLQRMQIVREMVEEKAVHVARFNPTGNSRLARQFSLVQLGDWVSFYLAMLNGVDPTPITQIDLFKSRLAEF